MMHVLPINDLKPHVESGPCCWCNPRLERPCNECAGDDPACWSCGGFGMVDASPFDAALVIHNAADGRP